MKLGSGKGTPIILGRVCHRKLPGRREKNAQQVKKRGKRGEIAGRVAIGGGDGHAKEERGGKTRRTSPH